MLISNTSAYKSRNLLVQVPKQQSFRLNEGSFAATTKSVRPLHKHESRGSVPWVRILLSVTVPGQESIEFMAKADFRLDLNNGSELRNVIDRLLGKDHLAQLSGQQFNLTDLEGKAVEIEVEHVNLDSRGGFDFPLVVVRDIQLPGTLRLTGPRK